MSSPFRYQDRGQYYRNDRGFSGGGGRRRLGRYDDSYDRRYDGHYHVSSRHVYRDHGGYRRSDREDDTVRSKDHPHVDNGSDDSWKKRKLDGGGRKTIAGQQEKEGRGKDDGGGGGDGKNKSRTGAGAGAVNGAKKAVRVLGAE